MRDTWVFSVVLELSSTCIELGTWMLYHLMMRSFHKFHLDLHFPFPFHSRVCWRIISPNKQKGPLGHEALHRKWNVVDSPRKSPVRFFYQNLFTICAHPKMVMADIGQCCCRIADHKQWRYTKQIKQKNCCFVLRPQFSYFFHNKRINGSLQRQN